MTNVRKNPFETEQMEVGVDHPKNTKLKDASTLSIGLKGRTKVGI